MLQTESAWMREELSKYQSAAPCETCLGARLRPEPLAVKIAGEDISMSTRRSVRHALEWFSTLAEKDRKSTRLNSSHLVISYAVFCLKKKNKHKKTSRL